MSITRADGNPSFWLNHSSLQAWDISLCTVFSNGRSYWGLPKPKEEPCATRALSPPVLTLSRQPRKVKPHQKEVGVISEWKSSARGKCRHASWAVVTAHVHTPTSLPIARKAHSSHPLPPELNIMCFISWLPQAVYESVSFCSAANMQELNRVSQPSGLAIVMLSFLLHLSQLVCDPVGLGHIRFTLCLPLAETGFSFHFCYAIFTFLGCYRLDASPSINGGLLSF